MNRLELPNRNRHLNITVIGGGSGNYAVLSALKHISGINITTIVPATDSGGSSGIIRDQYGILPPGDIRQCLVALLKNSQKQQILRDLFTYRFNISHTFLYGHTFGNIFMTTLSRIYSDEQLAIEKAKLLLDIKANIYPIIQSKVELIAKYEDGKIKKGEKNIDKNRSPTRIKNLYLNNKYVINQKAINSIINADYIIFSPSDLFTSTGAILIAKEIIPAFKSTKAKLIYIANLVTKTGQTFNYKLSDFNEQIAKWVQKPMNYIIHNNEKIPTKIAKIYQKEGCSMVINDMSSNQETKVICTNLLNKETYRQKKNDTARRSLLRHDPNKILPIIKKILYLSKDFSFNTS